MKVKFDFALSKRFGVVEQTIFRLLLCGVNNSQAISTMLLVFSEEVIANAIRKLVNHQIINAGLDMYTLSISESILAIIDSCIKNSYEINVPENLFNSKSDRTMIIGDMELKETILSQLIPDIKLKFLAKSLDFRICERGETSG